MLSLIGYRGVGKTSVAQLLALRLGWDWVDADVEIELRAGKSIAAIFADDGEPAFRDLESAVIAELTGVGQPSRLSKDKRDAFPTPDLTGQAGTPLHEVSRLVLACGGGAVLRLENRQALQAAGKVVWLQARPETILERIATDATTAGRRPQLTTSGGAIEVQELLAQRLPLYQQCANLTIDTEGKSPAEVAEEILARLN